jgi:hypothetical protein
LAESFDYEAEPQNFYKYLTKDSGCAPDILGGLKDARRGSEETSESIAAEVCRMVCGCSPGLPGEFFYILFEGGEYWYAGKNQIRTGWPAEGEARKDRGYLRG